MTVKNTDTLTLMKQKQTSFFKTMPQFTTQTFTSFDFLLMQINANMLA